MEGNAKDRIVITLIVALAAAGIWANAEGRKIAKHAPLAETEAALAYSCGHVAGQRAIMRLAPALFPTPGAEEAGCARWAIVAKHKGFGS